MEASSVVYGSDDRVEVWTLDDASVRELGARSVVALVEDATVAALATAGEPGALRSFEARSWAERRGLCERVRFAGQPSAATCSGVLVGEDLVLTAGHCARGLDCSALSVVFGFHYNESGLPNVLAAGDVYRCRAVETFEIPDVRAHLDYGFLRLDRPVVAPRRPLPLATTAEAVSRSAPLIALGHGGGVPMKAQRVPIFAARAEELDYFVTALDAFEGDSGAPVLSAGGTVIGIFSGGKPDYEETAAGCNDVAAELESNAGERVTYAFQAGAALCSGPAADAALCSAPGAPAVGVGCSVPRHAAEGATGALALLSAAFLGVLFRRRKRKRASRERD